MKTVKGLGLVNNRTNLIVFGIFLLTWSINGFFIGGNTLKLFLLFLGFSVIVFTSFTLPKSVKFANFCGVTFVMLLSFWFIAIIRDQTTARISIIIFDIICYLLLLSGYLLARNIKYLGKVSQKLILLLTILTILGVLMYIKFQAMLVMSSVGLDSRAVVGEDDETGINVIGIAYTNAIIFFILYHFLNYYKLNKWLKAILILSMVSTFLLIFSTQSRGALIYIIVVLLLNNFYRLKSLKSIFKTFLISILIAFAAILLFFQVLPLFPSMAEKFAGTLNRFESLIQLTDDIQADQSSSERVLLVEEFYNDIGNIVLIGQANYTTYPHNQFIEIIMRWGIFLGLPLLLFSVLNFFKSLKILLGRFDINPLINMVVFLLIFSFLQSMSSMSLEMNRMLWFGLGFLAGLPGLFNFLIVSEKMTN